MCLYLNLKVMFVSVQFKLEFENEQDKERSFISYAPAEFCSKVYIQ